ncbi:Phosphatidylinositol-specific phospholipase C, X domain protein [Oesophagostomum dentatum]|uniref:Phosphatidylinositol-specific phospholipase C, X domain protein n=1 Tax=Oesophagostomum dentatum TaxID=61180 RepID=A0A0B1TFG0_OESDE|nr:Phosphatidylinositol-specific phospholipase C, X domain protein [Oesophagostomum dentatum]
MFQRDPRLNDAIHPKLSENALNNQLNSIGYPAVAETMNSPLSRYFINSSHNTYCKGLQASFALYFPDPLHKETVADAEMYRQEVCVAIAECAFKTSPYPVILSIENHLKSQQQEQLVAIFKEVFGSNLLLNPLEKYPLVERQELPSPNELRQKILVKGKRPEEANPAERERKQSVQTLDVSDTFW